MLRSQLQAAGLFPSVGPRSCQRANVVRQHQSNLDLGSKSGSRKKMYRRGHDDWGTGGPIFQEAARKLLLSFFYT